MSETVIEPVEDTRLSEGDHDRYAHYVRKSDIMSSAVEGHEVTALCGKRWFPNRDPDKYPVCPDCKSIMEQLRGAQGN